MGGPMKDEIPCRQMQYYPGEQIQQPITKMYSLVGQVLNEVDR